ncbi:TPA: SGNH/GDSL hydrolase family protein [Klebsiella pneumoniae]
MPDAWDNMQSIDKFVNSSDETIITRTGEQLDTLHGVNVKADNQLTQQQADFETSQEERDAVVEETRQNLIPLSRQYMTLSAAQADIANIPEGSTTYYRSPDDSALAIEVMNVGGTLQPTGRKMPSSMPMGYQSATAVSSGAANTIAITIPGLLVDGSLIYFLSPILNTAAVSVTVTDSKGNSVTRSVLRRANAVLVGGELIQYNPVLMVYRGAPTDNFMLIASGATASEVAASLTAYKTTNDALTATLKNQVPIPVTVGSVADDIYTATSSITSGELQGGRLFLFTPPSANTTRTPKLKLNAWGAYNITRIDGGQVAAGDLASGRALLLHWHAGANQFRVMTYADERTKIYGTALRATMTSDASTPNDLSVTVDGYIDNGTLVVLEPPATNTGAVAVTVVDRYGNQIVRSVFKGANAPLTGGEIKYAEPVLLMYRGAPQNNFKIISSGDLSTPVAKLQSDVEALKTSFTDPYAKLAKKLIGDGTTANTGPFGSISFTNGVRTTVKKRLIFTSIGSSVGVGAGSSDGSKFAPNALFIEAMKAQLAGYGNFEFINDNQCIPTQALQQFSAQLQNSPYFTSTNENDWPDFVLIIGGMNDAPVGNFNNGLTFPAQQGKLEALIDECKAKGAVVIVATSPHHNPLSTSVTAMDLGSLNVSWPVRTFNVDTNYTFDAAARTINGGAFSYGTGNAATSWGGQILRVGHTLRILSGDNAGDYTIAAISEDRNTITVAESFPASGLMKTTIRHIGLNSMKEEVLDPPPSRSFVERDWSGSGTKTVGAARFGMVNSMFRSVARDKAVFLMECEIPWFRDGVEVHGWNALFDGTNYNHPNDLGYTVSYKAGADKAAFDLCSLIYGEKYYLPL